MIIIFLIYMCHQRLHKVDWVPEIIWCLQLMILLMPNLACLFAALDQVSEMR